MEICGDEVIRCLRLVSIGRMVYVANIFGGIWFDVIFTHIAEHV